MILFPAIDIKGGDCVRLIRGKRESATVFNTDPANQASFFKRMGCSWIHLVDLDGAYFGKIKNAKSIEAVRKEVDIPIQLGGGIRDLKSIELWLSKGLNRVILGTAALEDSSLVEKSCKLFPNSIAVGIDVRDGYVCTEGWEKTSKTQAIDLAKKLEDFGVTAIIYTDINRDGVLSGPNTEKLDLFANEINVPIILSGGVSSHKDLKLLKGYESLGVSGVVVGRAIYDKKINIKEAIAILG
ncbi:MAG: 1-(5-phosphoribosyl)-5-[(5-phosphoribosylamino)methylideneamino] imidazole-4-carboxamide isomerase [Alphaproteobacteria bacterium MarineAlpha7_Bin1]|nr:MAG: 1-(5-phosphoribosyl)-5-[(5-phosphoribosylamino)methylideneamino] imidazole-4-carboxamide isomerase [Alphaproteobacteria bacterium MarineAlpha7_Bin1]|tara:strand:+ start:326 stop:1048 length:723 start_codon:yes stop_codon:yes gene_type:complete